MILRCSPGIRARQRPSPPVNCPSSGSGTSWELAHYSFCVKAQYAVSSPAVAMALDSTAVPSGSSHRLPSPLGLRLPCSLPGYQSLPSLDLDHSSVADCSLELPRIFQLLRSFSSSLIAAFDYTDCSKPPIDAASFLPSNPSISSPMLLFVASREVQSCRGSSWPFIVLVATPLLLILLPIQSSKTQNSQ
jgi:hypothetical protein